VYDDEYTAPRGANPARNYSLDKIRRDPLARPRYRLHVDDRTIELTGPQLFSHNVLWRKMALAMHDMPPFIDAAEHRVFVQSLLDEARLMWA
jgi:hypothetical protein